MCVSTPLVFSAHSVSAGRLDHRIDAIAIGTPQKLGEESV